MSDSQCQLKNLTYVSRFFLKGRHALRRLLWLEEWQMQRDIRNFDIDNASLTPCGQGFMTLSVPGLAEKRPSVLRGDHLFAR